MYMGIQKGMYGLPQAGILTNKLLKQHLTKKGYYEIPNTLPGCGSTSAAPLPSPLLLTTSGSSMSENNTSTTWMMQ
jgi:hypothetical protein